MNKVRNIVGLIAVCATAAFFTGCDEKDTVAGGGNNNNNNNNAGFAPAALNGNTYNLTDAAGQSTIAFEAGANNYTLTPSGGGAAEAGTFTANKNADVYNVTLMSAAAAGDTNANSILNLTFTAQGAGNYTFDRPGQAQAAGSFALTTPPPPPTDTNNQPPPTNTNGVPASATVPSQITFTTGPGGGIGAGTVYTTTFSGGTSGTFTSVNQAGDTLGSGTFTYEPQGNNAHLRMNYTGQFQGDYDDATLMFTQQAGSGQANNYTGTQSVSGTVYPFNGTFTY